MTPYKQNRLREQSYRNLKKHLFAGPSPTKSEVRVRTDSEITLSKKLKVIF